MSKFYIYADGRWCEVETENGRVEGFRERARFCYLRGGRLHMARSAAVLRALRALAAGEPSAARDGAPLAHRHRRPRRRSRRPPPSTQTHHCCAHLHTGCQAAPAFAPALPALPAPPPTEPPRKRRRLSSEDEPTVTKSPAKNTPLKRQKIATETVGSSSSEKEAVTRATLQTQAVASIPSKQSQTLIQQSPFKHNVQIHQVDSSFDDDGQPLKPNHPKSVRKSTRSRTVNLELSSGHGNPNRLPPVKRHDRLTRLNIAKRDAQVVDSSSDANKTVAKESASKPEFTEAQKLVQKLLDSATEESSSSAHEVVQPRGRCKELLIAESDVLALRRYLARSGSGRAILSRFDNDESYKVRIFHRLNPLVTLERCKPLENLLRQRLTLKEFARNLGLRSVADVTPEKRYKMRRSVRKPSVASDSETDKENLVQPKKRKLWNRDKAVFSVRSSRSSELRPKIPKPTVNRDSSRDTSDSDTAFKRRVREQLKKKSIVKRRESFAEVRRQTRSTGMPSKETDKPNKVGEVSSVNVPKQNGLVEVRQTRQSGKFSANPSTIKEPEKATIGSDSDKMKLRLARVRSVEESEWEVVSKQSNASTANAVPVRTLREQNNDSDAFKPTKTPPKKANLINKPKPVSKGSPFKRKEDSKPNIPEQKPSEANTRVVRSMAKPVKLKKSSVANGREYSSLEDHAIVAWVSAGGRERLVNGNRLWRELAPQYQRLTGQSRSWHSLRNRYLRYVLPALPALALPPAQVSRLRAAAATGEIKSKSHRRNSIFAAPAVRSASARRLAAPRASPRRTRSFGEQTHRPAART